MVVFQKNSGRPEGLNLQSVLKETRVLDRYLGILVDYTCSIYEKVPKKNEAQAKKIIFLLKNHVFSL